MKKYLLIGLLTVSACMFATEHRHCPKCGSVLTSEGVCPNVGCHGYGPSKD